MKVVNNKKEYNKDDYYHLLINKNKVLNETQKAIEIRNYIRDEKGKTLYYNFTWITKKLVYTSNYSNLMQFNSPKSWKLEFNNSKGETIVCDNIDEFCENLGIINKDKINKK